MDRINMLDLPILDSPSLQQRILIKCIMNLYDREPLLENQYNELVELIESYDFCRNKYIVYLQEIIKELEDKK